MAMINDLRTDCHTIKYVDDTTIYQASNSVTDKTLQNSINSAISWSKDNSMRINASKTKELVINFSKAPQPIPPIQVDGVEIERVSSCTLLGIVISDSLTWNLHIEKIYKKANQRLFFILQLKRSKISPADMVKVYTSLVRPILEYACQLWHASLTVQQIHMLESIQERSLSMAYPALSYDSAMTQAKLTPLCDRREDLCKRLFNKAQDPTHKLFPLLPPERKVLHNTRTAYKYVLPKTKTDRYKNSFINHCLYKQW